MSIVSLPARKATTPRFVNLVQPFDPDGKNAILRIREIVGKRNPTEKVDEYHLDRVTSDIGGEAFLMEKREYNPDPSQDARYHVRLATCEEDGHHSCECLGFLKHGHCRHVAGLIALHNQGKI